MTLWAAYTPQGREFDLVEDCGVLEMEAFAPRKVEAVRTGNKRWPEPRVSPYLPNYVFVYATPAQWHWLNDIRYVTSIMGIPPRAELSVIAFRDRVETDFLARMAQIEAGERLSQYEPGDLLQIMTGTFAGELVRFGRMIEKANAMLPEIEATMTLMGRETKLKLDPLSVRAAT